MHPRRLQSLLLVLMLWSPCGANGAGEAAAESTARDRIADLEREQEMQSGLCQTLQQDLSDMTLQVRRALNLNLT